LGALEVEKAGSAVLQLQSRPTQAIPFVYLPHPTKGAVRGFRHRKRKPRVLAPGRFKPGYAPRRDQTEQGALLCILQGRLA
jgi:hypothetical protein